MVRGLCYAGDREPGTKTVTSSDRERREAAPRPREGAAGTGAVVLESVLTCPRCGFAKTETMPTDACQFFYECTQCKALLRPHPGDCCVFCSFGSVRCPPMQQDGCGSVS